ncbi:Uncharacterised protein [Mycobacteroides abscessus subsp. abscessus]|nr:Uncharacterised protein [Mycobacteroides abscessus subsp. abscessus]
MGRCASTGRSMRTSLGSSAVSTVFPSAAARYASTASPTRRTYRSKPTPATCPDCSTPSTLPAPRISRSFMATAMPAPRSLFCAIVESLSYAVSVSGTSGEYKK